MLDLAILHRDALQRAIASTVFDERYKYYYGGGWCPLVPGLKDDTWDALQCVSVDATGLVHGFLQADFRRPANYVNSLSVLHFGLHPFPFVRDFREFLSRLFTQFSMQKVNWSVNVGNPAQAMYERVVRKYGGRVVGTFRRDSRLWDGTLVDNVFYEILQEEFVAATAGRRASQR